MINAYLNEQERLLCTRADIANLDGVVWIDLFEPTREEEAALERALKLEIPTREEMAEIEISSRLYVEEGAIYVTATLPSLMDTDEPILAPVTFVLSHHRLLTVRYHEPRAFKTFPSRAARVPMGCYDGESVLLALLETQVDRMADIIERVGHDIAAISHSIFRTSGGKRRPNAKLQSIIEEIGREGDLTSNLRECLASLERVMGFLAQAMHSPSSEKEMKGRIKTITRDLRSLSDHADSLTHKVTFLLDATLGLINIEQNAIIKFFSVAAVVFLPPTLIASIYGMNFKLMPELTWHYGYPMAIGLMVLSAVLPYTVFKRRGWL